jgi:predicted amidohydrolase YtcJ
VLIAGAELDGGICDVRCEAGRIAAVAPRLAPAAGEPVLRAEGGALLPGLHDHHLHLFALAAALLSVRCGPPGVRDAAQLAAALRGAPERDGWLRGVGYHESVAGELDRDALDRLEPRRPLRLQHRSGALWLVNSAGAERLGLDREPTPDGVERDARGRATGRLYRCDAWLRERLGSPAPPLAPVGQLLARLGVTGATDATPTNGPGALEALRAAARSGALPQRLLVMGAPGLRETGDERAVRGALKILLDERALPTPAELEALIGRARAEGRAVAIHCVTRAELVLAAAALHAAGSRPGDRIEHASVAPPELAALVAELSLCVVTQPGFIRERGDDYAREVDAADRPWLYRCAGLEAAGVQLGAGTDAPFGDPDPWLAMRAAAERRTRDGLVLGPAEALSPERALALFTTPADAPGGRARRIAPGERADLCLLDRSWREAREDLSSRAVRATVCDGGLAWCRDPEQLRHG